MTTRSRCTVFTAAILISALTGCGQLGTAVVLWPPEDSFLESGDLITVLDESFLNKTYIVNRPNQRRLKEEIDQWRLRLFKRKRDAEAWAAGIAEWKDVYAECLYQGLPMRAEPDNTAPQVYRFRKGDYVKVLRQEDGPVQVGNLEGFWYKVLAHGGVEGYVFDYHLKVMSIDGDQELILNTKDTSDLKLEDFLARPWRPKYFDEMISRNQINLGTFRSAYGLFIDRKTQSLRIHLPARSITERWTDIVPVGADRYDFLGTSFRVTIHSNILVSIQYNFNGVEYYEAFVRLNRNVGDVIRGEMNRQEKALQLLRKNGPIYESRSYGKLVILEKNLYTWSEKSSMISQGLLTSEAGNSGTMRFDMFPASNIASAHEGVISLRFDNNETLHFLYAFEDGGLRFLYVPKSAIDDGKVVQTDQFFDPIRIFFKPEARE